MSAIFKLTESDPAIASTVGISDQSKPACCSKRVMNLRERMLSIEPSLCIERGLLVTEAYARFVAEPMVIRRAKALAYILDSMSIYIEDGELIVGNHASAPRAAPLFPEYQVDFLENEIDAFQIRPADRFQVSPAVKAQLLNIVIPAWRGKTLTDRANASLPPDVVTAQEIGVISGRGNITSGDGHIILNIEKVLGIGLEGIIAQAERSLAGLSPYLPTEFKKRQFLQAAIITLQAAQRFSIRFADKADQQAEISSLSPDRRVELREIASVCRQVPGRPARTFWEAVQSVYFVHLISQIESNGHSFSLGRLDQYLLPFYQTDLAGGRLTRQQAKEILELLWLKLFSIIKVRPWDHTRFGLGYPTYQNVTIGGQTENGVDSVNDISYLVLEAIQDIRLTQPNVSSRIFNGSSNHFLTECARTIRSGFGMPAIQNDEIIIPALLEKGVSVKDAYNYAMVGCMETAVPGKWGYRVTGMTFVNILKVLENTLYNGVDPKSGVQLLPGKGNLADFRNFEEMYSAFYDQYMYFARLSFQMDTVADICIEEMVPDAFASALVDDCLIRGLTIKEGGAIYDIISGPQSGIPNVANALFALKKLVFEEKILSPQSVMEALGTNFENPGGEVIRQRMLSAHKYGNDLDDVDSLAVRVSKDYHEEMVKYHHTRFGRGPIGGGYAGSTGNISANVPLGASVGATPDGRKAGEAIAEGISPVHGTDVGGPTKVMRSASKLPTIHSLCQLLNLRLSPNSLSTDAGIQRLVSLMRGFCNLRLWHVQFNTISTQMLLEAQLHPEKYRDLVVRVAGYSALFVTLDRATQDDIINRTMHELNGSE